MTPFHTVVLAGDRGGPDDLLRAAGVDAKVMAPIAGTPMIERVLATIAESPSIEGGCICGPSREVLDAHPLISRAISAAGLEWLPPERGPAASTVAALEHLDRWPVLVTTADHALLTPPIVDHFCTKAGECGADMLVGLARHADVMAAFPETRRTPLRFADDHYCGCNLFAFMSPEAIGVARFWERVEAHRKRPWRLFGALGLGSVLAYLRGRLSLEEALRRLSLRVGCTVQATLLPFPAAAVDVDSAADWKLVNTLATTP
jgi:GTP:adenosylcobinamide-phosphate guanylyltransferase